MLPSTHPSKVISFHYYLYKFFCFSVPAPFSPPLLPPVGVGGVQVHRYYYAILVSTCCGEEEIGYKYQRDKYANLQVNSSPAKPHPNSSPPSSFPPFTACRNYCSFLVGAPPLGVMLTPALVSSDADLEKRKGELIPYKPKAYHE